jgi:hypothetical protein
MFTNRHQREEMISEGWKAVSKVFVLAVILDVVYQLIALQWIYPGEALLVAYVLAILPYLLIRGPVNRLLSQPRQHPPNLPPSAGEAR